uniref:Putative secreted peptide n=1 Tax=Anopheles braziliensis TaxID=58242 RepID=A0A2M3ZXS5_9DIPT
MFSLLGTVSIAASLVCTKPLEWFMSWWKGGRDPQVYVFGVLNVGRRVETRSRTRSLGQENVSAECCSKS